MKKKLVDRSRTAALLGGPKKIREMPLLDRLEAGERIARELKREKAGEKCSELLRERALIEVDILIRQADYFEAENLAARFGFPEELNTIHSTGFWVKMQGRGFEPL